MSAFPTLYASPRHHVIMPPHYFVITPSLHHASTLSRYIVTSSPRHHVITTPRHCAITLSRHHVTSPFRYHAITSPLHHSLCSSVNETPKWFSNPFNFCLRSSNWTRYINDPLTYFFPSYYFLLSVPPAKFMTYPSFPLGTSFIHATFIFYSF